MPEAFAALCGLSPEAWGAEPLFGLGANETPCWGVWSWASLVTGPPEFQDRILDPGFAARQNNPGKMFESGKEGKTVWPKGASSKWIKPKSLQ